jgi:hypothetical protein
VVLVIAPWTRFWERNYFVDSVPVVQAVLTAPWGRGLVSGIGLVSLCAAIVEVVGWRRRRAADASAGRGESLALPRGVSSAPVVERLTGVDCSFTVEKQRR